MSGQTDFYCRRLREQLRTSPGGGALGELTTTHRLWGFELAELGTLEWKAMFLAQREYEDSTVTL